MAGLTEFKGRFFLNQPLIMTGALIATVPMLFLYIIGQRSGSRRCQVGTRYPAYSDRVIGHTDSYRCRNRAPTPYGNLSVR
jgi:hypothetical protein